MSDTSSDSDGDLLVEDSQSKFINILKNHRILLNKSQTPSVKVAKDKAMSELLKMYKIEFGEAMSSKQMMKKISNMKTEVKKKFDIHATGNKTI